MSCEEPTTCILQKAVISKFRRYNLTYIQIEILVISY